MGLQNALVVAAVLKLPVSYTIPQAAEGVQVVQVVWFRRHFCATWSKGPDLLMTRETRLQQRQIATIQQALFHNKSFFVDGAQVACNCWDNSFRCMEWSKRDSASSA